MGGFRTLDTQLDRVVERRAADRRRLVAPQAVAALAALRAAGAEVEVVGSLSRGEFRANSDVDFLVPHCGPMSETQIFNLVCDKLKDASFDLVYADRLAPDSLELMREDAHPRA